MIGRAFKATLDALEYWRKRKGAYQTVFKSGYGNVVLADLADFCHAFKTTAPPGGDALLAAQREGRRQVFLRIQHHLNLSPQQLSVLYRDVVNDSGEE